MIPFHKPFISGKETEYVGQIIQTGAVETNGQFSQQCEDFLQYYTIANRVLLTSSCTHALEMCALLANIKEGDEVIMPSYTFVSAANAFVLRGAKIVFVDIDPLTMNIDPKCIRTAITNKTKAVLIMHYGGIACDMDRILPIIKEFNLVLIEDAAHCIGSFYKGKHLGTFGDFGTLSFHYTKNIHCGEGGALIINNPSFIERAEIIREKGTNRKQFFERKVDKYSWVDMGSSYLLSEISAAFLWCQLNCIESVKKNRLKIWKSYYNSFQSMGIECMSDAESNNGHLFYIILKTRSDRIKLISYLKNKGVSSSFHYIPLHSSKFGDKVGLFHGTDRYTTLHSQRLLRLPLFYNFEKYTKVQQLIIEQNAK